MLVSALPFHLQFKEDLEGIGFKFDPCNPCAANRKINRKQHAFGFHFDDLMSGHVDKKVNDEFLKWPNNECGSCGKVTTT